MNERAVVADTSVLIHFLEGNPEAREWLLGREVHISIATEIELLTMGATKRNAQEVIGSVLALCSIWDIRGHLKIVFGSELVGFRGQMRRETGA